MEPQPGHWDGRASGTSSTGMVADVLLASEPDRAADPHTEELPLLLDCTALCTLCAICTLCTLAALLPQADAGMKAASS